jgi:hypothetical protein
VRTAPRRIAAVLDALPLDVRAVAAAAALVALPGILVVRSPWRAMPLLSLAFWIVSWTWLGGASRTRALHVLLACFAALGVFRILRPGPLPRAGRAQVSILGLSLVLGLPFALRAVPPGPRLPVEALTAELLAWHDGWPVSFEPLLPRHPFEASGLAALAADVALLSGAPGYRTAFLVAVLGEALLLLALWSLAATQCASGRAAVTAAAGTLAAVTAPGAGLLATAFAVEAVALWHDRRGNPSAFAAGACAAAAIATDLTTGFCAVALAAFAFTSGRATLARSPSMAVAPRRMRVALGTAVALGAALLFRRPPIEAPEVAPLAAIALAGLLCACARERPGRWPLFAAAALAAAGAFAFITARGPAVTPDDLAALHWIRVHAHPLALICASDTPAAKWIPAIAARPTSVPVRWGWPVPGGECDVRISLSGMAPPGAPAMGPPAFRAGSAAVWTTSQNR